MSSNNVSRTIADAGDFPAFKKELREAFSIAVIEQYGELPNGPIPDDDDLASFMSALGAMVLRILSDGRRVGGAVVTIDEETHHNTLDLFFLKVGEHGDGLGHKA
ncbi:hypothetical protein J2858_004818 [Neorhizobium galegae]|uniref:hypothetical protein n=1 Tax=Neorhizobium galegae TaxID=399 RepID=UPI001FD98835|nr:hypothetical protein [Neorhizobium galegae]MBP2551875.1 hypothetical protein [Neorhizobium galegae]